MCDPWSIPRMKQETTEQGQKVRDDTKRDITTQNCVMQTIVRDDTKRWWPSSSKGHHESDGKKVSKNETNAKPIATSW